MTPNKDSSPAYALVTEREFGQIKKDCPGGRDGFRCLCLSWESLAKRLMAERDAFRQVAIEQKRWRIVHAGFGDAEMKAQEWADEQALALIEKGGVKGEK